MASYIKIKQTKSEIGRTKKQRETLKGLGLTHLGRERVIIDSPENRGMIVKVSHLVCIEPFEKEGE
jgi:large subunit ribosomal protein L30